LHETFSALPFSNEKPSVINCDTVRGKGLPSIEARADRWFCNFSGEEITSLLKELHGDATTELTSEILTVR
jgi:transketolase